MVLQISSWVVVFNAGEGTNMFLVEHDCPKGGLDILAGGVQRMVWHVEGTCGFVRCRRLRVKLFILVVSKDERGSDHGFFKDRSQSRGAVAAVAGPVEEKFDLFNNIGMASN